MNTQQLTSELAHQEQEINGSNTVIRSQIMLYFTFFECGTQHDIAAYLKVDSNKVHKRLSELQKLGKIYASDIAVRKNGKLCTLWVREGVESVILNTK